VASFSRFNVAVKIITNFVSPVLIRTFLNSVCVVFCVNLLLFASVYTFYAYGIWHPRMLLLALWAMAAWSVGIGVAACVTRASGQAIRSLLMLLPALVLPYLWLAAEFINTRRCEKSLLCCVIFRFVFWAMPLLAVHLYVLFGAMPASWRRLALSCWCVVISLSLLVPGLLVINSLLNGVGIDEQAVIAICQTNWHEARDYFFGINRGLWITAFALFAGGCCVAGSGRLLRSAGRYQSGLLAVSAFSLALLAPLSWLAVYCVSSAQLYGSYLAVLMRTPFTYQADIAAYRALQQQRAATAFSVLHERRSSGEDGLFVLIIGESLNRNYMSCYGYNRPTTPFQDALFQESTAFAFGNSFSNHVMTVNVLHLALTQQNQYRGESWPLARAVSLFDLARANGYLSWYISNQGKSAMEMTPVAALTASADGHFYLQAKQHKKRQRSYDDALLQGFPAKAPTRGLMVIHLYGNHYPYDRTVPPDFAAPAGFSDYERSVLFNDYVLSCFFSRFRELGVQAVLYCPDHSDGVSMGRGHDPRPERFTREMTEIPFWVWLSPEYATRHPDLVRGLQSAQRRCFTNDLLFDVMLRVMVVQSPLAPSRYDITSDEYAISPANAMTLWGAKRLFPDP